MSIKGEILSEEKDVRNIFRRIKERDFSGNTGLAVKNSVYQLVLMVIFKFGSLFFTIILARMLMPGRMGLYSLALSTLVIFASFSDLGIGNALMTFVSKKLGQNNMVKARAYFMKLLRWKLFLTFFALIILVMSGYFIAEFYYGKPIFFALLAGVLYVPFVTMVGFFEQGFKAMNNFRFPLFKEIVLQVLRLVLVPLGILFFLGKNFSDEFVVAGVIFILAFCYFVTLIMMCLFARKNLLFLRVAKKELSNKENLDLKRFVLPLTAVVLSGAFFGYIDVIMLGHFVSGEFISYYSVAFALIGSASSILGFASISLFPILARIKGSRLERGFRKSRNLILIFSVFAGIFVYFLAKYIILIIYGSAYQTSVPVLQYFSVLLVVLPLTSFYTMYYMSKKNTKILAKLLVFTTIINVLLNYVFIVYGLQFGEFYGVLGACLATIVSKVVYLVVLVVFRERNV